MFLEQMRSWLQELLKQTQGDEAKALLVPVQPANIADVIEASLEHL